MSAARDQKAAGFASCFASRLFFICSPAANVGTRLRRRAEHHGAAAEPFVSFGLGRRTFSSPDPRLLRPLAPPQARPPMRFPGAAP
jgi:hypothetical protein